MVQEQRQISLETVTVGRRGDVGWHQGGNSRGSEKSEPVLCKCNLQSVVDRSDVRYEGKRRFKDDSMTFG